MACFSVINVESVSVNFLFVQSTIPLILVILGSTLLGGLIVGFFGILRQYSLQRTIRQLRKQLSSLTSPNDATDLEAFKKSAERLATDSTEKTEDLTMSLPKEDIPNERSQKQNLTAETMDETTMKTTNGSNIDT